MEIHNVPLSNNEEINFITQLYLSHGMKEEKQNVDSLLMHIESLPT